MATGANSAANVTTGKGVTGGYIFSAPFLAATVDALLADKAFATLPAAFVCLGHITSDGIVISESKSTDTTNDMNGDPIMVTAADRTENARFTLAERSEAALKEQYGHDNVNVSGGVAVIEHNNKDKAHRVYVAELVKKDGKRLRQIIPDGQVSEVGDLTENSSTILAREITIACNTYTWTEGSGDSAVTHSDTMVEIEQLATE